MGFSRFSAMMVDLKKLRRARRITPQSCDCRELKASGFTAEEVKLAGFEAKHLREAKSRGRGEDAAGLEQIIPTDEIWL